jgi:hypothetical protein
MWIVAIYGFTLSCALLGLAAWQTDGFAFLAVLALSILSTLVGIGNKWKLNLPRRHQSTITPPGDVVIRYSRRCRLKARSTWLSRGTTVVA